MRNMRKNGFTLVELMIVVAIIGILAAVAYPAYTRHVVKSRRTDAQRMLQEQAAGIERYYTVNSTYMNGASCGNFTAASMAYYGFACVGSASSFTLTATPIPGRSQASDGNLTLNNTGAKGGSNNSGNWAN